MEVSGEERGVGGAVAAPPLSGPATPSAISMLSSRISCGSGGSWNTIFFYFLGVGGAVAAPPLSGPATPSAISMLSSRISCGSGGSWHTIICFRYFSFFFWGGGEGMLWIFTEINYHTEDLSIYQCCGSGSGSARIRIVYLDPHPHQIKIRIQICIRIRINLRMSSQNVRNIRLWAYFSTFSRAWALFWG